jgi:hypothetical protein
VAVALPADQDVYVRDWTQTTATFDNGAEPSTNAVFYNTSDVWNHGTNAPGTPNANGWYDTDNMFAGAGALGDNFAFVRVHRNTSGSAATVTAHFLVSPFGTGSAYQDAGTTADPTLTFAATDTEQVLASGYPWHQDATASIHACLAVQISSPDDPYVAPGLLGSTPGPGDYLVINDNNKAQRNLSVSNNVPHFGGMGFALIHNAALYPRNIGLRYESPAAEQLRGSRVEVIGGGTAEFRSGGELLLKDMQPGENRWIALRHQLAGTDPVAIDFLELDGQKPVSGFTILARPVSVDEAIRDNLRDHVQVFNRLAAAFKVGEAKAEAAAAEALQLNEPNVYTRFVVEHAGRMREVLQKVAHISPASDAFGVSKSLQELAAAAGRNQAEQTAAEHGMLLSRVDALATMLQKAEGDPADILQMVRWQEALYRTRPALGRLGCSERVVTQSQRFVRRFSQKQAEWAYPALLRELGECFRETAKVLGGQRGNLEKAAVMERAQSLAGMEKAHREFLLGVQNAGGMVER